MRRHDRARSKTAPNARWADSGSEALVVLVFVLIALLPAMARAQSGYVGDEACGTCHVETRHAYERTIHARVLNERNGASTRAKRGCEACHGPGLDHVRSGGKGEPAADWVDFGSREPEAIRRENEVCLSCHAGSRVKLWPGSAHDANDVGCATCHDTKTPASPRHLLEAEDQTTGCGGCHPAARAQQLRNRHMPTRPGPAGAGGEGWMDCSSCHNPHGTVAESLIEANSVNESCYACHAEKRGPFLWEHSPVNESCLNCHLPHGSIRPNMLRMAGPRLCQTCHIEVLHPSENRRSTDRFSVGQSCGHCHIKVHGSNHPSGNFLTR